MKIIINTTSNQPIYEQIGNQIKWLIIEGELKRGEPLPSIRGLAKDLKISVITIKRAYDDLEKEGYIFTQVGKGCFVNGIDTNEIKALAIKSIEGSIEKICEKAKNAKIAKEELIDIIKRNY